jgi:hypothetical protein
MSYDLELYEEGIISEDVFAESFETWWNGGKRVNVWELQQKRNKQQRESKKNGFWNKFCRIFRK